MAERTSKGGSVRCCQMKPPQQGREGEPEQASEPTALGNGLESGRRVGGGRRRPVDGPRAPRFGARRLAGAFRSPRIGRRRGLGAPVDRQPAQQDGRRHPHDGRAAAGEPRGEEDAHRVLGAHRRPHRHHPGGEDGEGRRVDGEEQDHRVGRGAALAVQLVELLHRLDAERRRGVRQAQHVGGDVSGSSRSSPGCGRARRGRGAA